MLWVALCLIVVGAASLTGGLVLYTNGSGVAPRNRTKEDPTGLKRAGSRVAWPEVFRRIPSSLGVMLDKDAGRDARLAALGSALVLAAVLAGCGAILAFVTAFVPR